MERLKELNGALLFIAKLDQKLSKLFHYFVNLMIAKE
jgi:hypothetical protein